MTLTQNDLKAIGELLDEKIDTKIDQKLDQKFEQKLAPVYEFIDFAKTALLSLLDESEEHFKQKLPERVKKLEDIHPRGHHTS